MIIALVGASGAGKTTLLNNLLRLRPEARPLLSFTTRDKRDSDIDGEYSYISEDEYDQMVASGEFLWLAGARGKRYGTRKADVARALDDTKLLYFPILVPEVLKALYETAFTSGHQKDLHFIYLRVWEEDELRRRLLERGDRPENIQKSMDESRNWNEQAQTLGIRFEVIDGRQTPEQVCEQALALIEKYKKTATS